MKMKRYFAPDARQALRLIREEQGPDAVILSNRKVKDGVEVIAAVDYEDAMMNASLGNPETLNTSAPYQENVAHNVQNTMQNNQASNAYGAATINPHLGNAENTQVNTSLFHENIMPEPTAEKIPESSAALSKIQNELAGLRNIMEAPLMQFSWGESGRVQPLFASLLKQLMTLGLSSKLSQSIAKKLEKQGLSKHSWLESLNYLSEIVPVQKEDILVNGGVVALIGPTGVGKTTTIAKLAARFALKHGRRSVTLITTDNYRIGAHEQLRSYGRILGIPVHVASDSEELKNLLLESTTRPGERHLTLIDTAGVSQKDVRMTEQITSLNHAGIEIKNHLVLSATGQLNLQDNVIRSFGKTNLAGCIITKIDEAASLGEIMSVLIQHNLPMSFICDGQKVPDDLHPARGKLLVKEAVQLMRSSTNTLSDEELAYKLGGVPSNGNV